MERKKQNQRLKAKEFIDSLATYLLLDNNKKGNHWEVEV
jgi:hypothetical protein